MAISFKRSDRVADSIVKEISEMIIKGEIRDPRVSAAFITGVKVADNLSFAEVFFTVMKDFGNKDEVLSGLKSAKGFIKGRLAKRLKMRRIPELKFSFDSALEEGYKVDELLRGIDSEE